MKALHDLKDLDFNYFHESLPIAESSKEEVSEFFNSIRRDVEFFTQNNIMDYSLLIIVMRNPTNASKRNS